MDPMAAALAAAGLCHLVRDRRVYILGTTRWRRPDELIDCGQHVVFIKVDEDQHKRYCVCEETRSCFWP